MPHPVIFGTFCDDITPETLGRFYERLAGATQRGFGEIHLLFQTGGGSVSDGISLYNYFRSFPISLHLYNTGGVDSAGLIAFVGVERRQRHAAEHAGFVLHKVKRSALAPEGAAGHLSLSKMLAAEDARCESIIRGESGVPEDRWADYTLGSDVFITAQEALQYGLVGDICDFKPPTGSKLFDF